MSAVYCNSRLATAPSSTSRPPQIRPLWSVTFGAWPAVSLGLTRRNSLFGRFSITIYVDLQKAVCGETKSILPIGKIMIVLPNEAQSGVLNTESTPGLKVSRSHRSSKRNVDRHVREARRGAEVVKFFIQSYRIATSKS